MLGDVYRGVPSRPVPSVVRLGKKAEAADLLAVVLVLYLLVSRASRCGGYQCCLACLIWEKLSLERIWESEFITCEASGGNTIRVE